MQTDQVFGGRYQLVGSLGEGGMANVYKAHDLILDRDVALKIMRMDMRDDPVAQKRFENEIRASTELVHPNITQVYDYGDEDHNQYLVTEYIAGPDLKRYEIDNYPLPLTKVIDIMSQILSGIQVAHDHGIVHRDLKPQNILMTDDGTAKITDFGIARAQSSFGMTQTNMAIGSVHYMAPEQVRGETATPQSDIYSLGIMLYELLAGKVPFDGETSVAVAVKQTTDPMPLVRKDDPRIPQALENVILKATAKNPAERYGSANEMREDLVTALSPDRVNEARFISSDEQDQAQATKVMPAVAETKNNADVTTTRYAQQTSELPQQSGGKKRHKKSWILGILALLIALCVGVTIYGLQKPAEAKVPDVTGKSLSAAKSNLKASGFEVGQVTKRDSETIKTNHVLSVKPDAGKKVKRGTKINLVVSTGSRKIRFGDYRNERLDSVTDGLKAKGYTITTSHEHSDDVPAGYIMKQSIKPDKKVIPHKTTVNFVVSVGPEQTTMTDDTPGQTISNGTGQANKTLEKRTPQDHRSMSSESSKSSETDTNESSITSQSSEANESSEASTPSVSTPSKTTPSQEQPTESTKNDGDE